MKIPRYLLLECGVVYQSDEGEFVEWSDVEKLLALRAAEAAEVDRWRSFTMQQGWTGTLPIGLMEATNAARKAAGVDQ